MTEQFEAANSDTCNAPRRPHRAWSLRRPKLSYLDLSQARQPPSFIIARSKMKLTIGLSAALASFVAAAPQAAEVYMLPAPQSALTTVVSPSIARLILLQRIAPIGQGPAFRDVPDDANPDDVVDLMNRFGKAPTPLFPGKDDASPKQLLVMLEGMTEKDIKTMGDGFKLEPALLVKDPPSTSAHEKLVKNDFYNAGITNEHKCSLDENLDPFEEKCWSGKANVVKYDITKHPKILNEFFQQIPRLSILAKTGQMETTVVLLPSKSTSAQQWSEKSQELRRRQAETVLASVDETAEPSAAPTSPVEDKPVFKAPRASVPACFTSLDSCSQGTGNCTGHGSCVNKYANMDGSEGKEVCYTCHCLATVSKQGSVTHWAGHSCSRQDISVQFWLFAGFFLAIISVLYLAIGMLYGVGEEKLPGVIGAGVSPRTSK
ncbi:hypothetical protein G7046_g8122 [Stylonectria norvegica]|nr:hypothetical protein G7046_g8122 [Stylonectria norvegica]